MAKNRLMMKAMELALVEGPACKGRGACWGSWGGTWETIWHQRPAPEKKVAALGV